MDRLTVKIDEFYIPKKLCTVNRYEEVNDCDSCIDCCKQHDEGSNTYNGCPIQECFDRLGVYENLDEQGLLLRLPCKVGDTVYNCVPIRGNRFTYREDTVSKISIEDDGIFIHFRTGLSKK